MTAQDPRIESAVRDDLDATIQTVRGEVTAAMIVDAARRFYDLGPTRHLVWDFSEGTVSGLSTFDMHRVADLIVPLAPQRPGGKTAAVTTSDLDHPYALLFETFMKQGQSSVEYRTFRRLDLALEWIAQD